MLIQPSAIVEAARSLINTPYQHQGRTPQKGLDCLGVVILTAKIAGVIDRDFDFLGYSRSGNGLLQVEIERYCAEWTELTEGAIALFDLDGRPNHCGIISRGEGRRQTAEGFNLIHAYENAGIVKEHELIPWWKNRIEKIYAFPNVTY
jgi:cell wall-associated NlpC family hydrolase